jgi:hypothetical protein
VPAFGEAFASTTPGRVNVAMYSESGTLISHDFGLTVVCP